MSLKSKLTALDKLVQKGDFISAVNQYFADSVISHYGQADVVTGKGNKISGLEYFMDTVDSVNEITLHDVAINGTETLSLYTFDFTQKGGRTLTWYEIVRRVWDNEMVVEEEYILADDAKAAKATFNKIAPKKAATKKTTAKKAAPAKAKAAPKKAAAKKAPKTKAAPKKKAATKKTSGPDDLKKIEGIGPKIASLLVEGGYELFAKVAKAKPAKLKEILLAAGSRYRMHDPETWPAQAKMAAAGKWEELKKWQDELKGGKKA